MAELYLGIAGFLVLNVLLGLIRVFRGPTRADRMLVAQLFGTTGVAVLLLLAQARQAWALHDVALVYAVLAGVSVVVLVRRAWPLPESPDQGSER